jgi:hypothetical protein
MNRRPRERSEPNGAGRVIGMVVCEHDRPDAGSSSADLLEMTLVVRSGVDDDRRGLAHHVRVCSFELTNPRIRREHAGDAEHSDQSCQKTDRGRRSSSSASGSRVAMRSSSSSSTLAHAEMATTV